MAAKAGMKITRQSVLADIVSARSCTYGAEIGVWQAQTLAPLLKRFPRLHMVGVDRWEAVGAYEGKDMEAARGIAIEALKPYRGRVNLMPVDTLVAAAHFDDFTFDFVFIDASHDTPAVLADIAAWAPKVKHDGALIGHDSNLPSVRAALDEALPGWLQLPANVWLWLK